MPGGILAQSWGLHGLVGAVFLQWTVRFVCAVG